jgi:hypothetical protein
MITIRSSKVISEPILIGFEATLKTAHAVYELSSTASGVDDGISVGGGLYGRIAWPRALFRFGADLVLEQQMFLPSGCSDVAISWQLRGRLVPAQLIIKPHFAGCGPRSYRDRGFRRDAEENGGRLYWLPHVLGPKIIADTNGQYHDEPFRFPEIVTGDANRQRTFVPGIFEFQLTQRPCILILSSDKLTRNERSRHLGLFLAGLLSQNESLPGTLLPQEELEKAELIAA